MILAAAARARGRGDNDFCGSLSKEGAAMEALGFAAPNLCIIHNQSGTDHVLFSISEQQPIKLHLGASPKYDNPLKIRRLQMRTSPTAFY